MKQENISSKFISKIAYFIRIKNLFLKIIIFGLMDKNDAGNRGEALLAYV